MQMDQQNGDNVKIFQKLSSTYAPWGADGAIPIILYTIHVIVLIVSIVVPFVVFRYEFTWRVIGASF